MAWGMYGLLRARWKDLGRERWDAWQLFCRDCFSSRACVTASRRDRSCLGLDRRAILTRSDACEYRLGADFVVGAGVREVRPRPTVAEASFRRPARRRAGNRRMRLRSMARTS